MTPRHTRGSPISTLWPPSTARSIWVDRRSHLGVSVIRELLGHTVAATIAAVGIISSQGRGNPTEWPTADGDAQHTSWIRTDVSISPETMSHPGFELQWKTTLESPVRHGVSLGAGVITSGVNIFTPLSMIGAPSNQVFAVDNDTGNLFWTRRFEGRSRRGRRRVPAASPGR